MAENLTEEYLLRIADIAWRNVVVTTREVEALGIPRLYLSQLVAGNDLQRWGRGVYTYGYALDSPRLTAAVVCAAAPRSVVCSLSAAYLHGLVTEAPRALWITVQPGTRPPELNGLHLEVVRVPATRVAPYVEYLPAGQRLPEVRLTNKEKTMVDLLRFRNRVGRAAVLEALRAYLALHDDTLRLIEAARENRASEPLERYLELVTVVGEGQTD